MKRWVYAHTVVDGDPGQLDQMLRERVCSLLRQATDTPPSPVDVDGSFRLDLPSGVARTAHKDVRARTEVAEAVDDRTRIGLAWHAEPARHAFPTFEGALELHPLSARHAQLTLVGGYRIPFGPVGAVVDGIGLHAVAQHTVERLVERLGDALERAVERPEPAPVPAEPSPPLVMRVADVMTPDPMLFDEALSLRTAALLLVHRNVQGAPVVSDTGALVGVLSEHDLLEKEAAFRPRSGRDARERERRRAAVAAGEACSRPARVTVPDASLREAARAMLDHATARLVVVDGSAVVGIITRHDVLKALLRSDAELQASVEALLASLAEPDVRAQVLWGECTLSGTVSLRSRVAQVVRRVAEIDGIVAVHGEPSWRDDDVLASAYGLRAP